MRAVDISGIFACLPTGIQEHDFICNFGVDLNSDKNHIALGQNKIHVIMINYLIPQDNGQMVHPMVLMLNGRSKNTSFSVYPSSRNCQFIRRYGI
jgi:hypothetical protein